MAKQNKVAVNLAQDFTNAEKAQARDNIGAAAAKEWNEVAVDTTKSDSTEMNLIADLDFDGCVGYYFDNNASLRLTWWHNGIEDTPVFRIYDNNNYTDINSPQFQDPTPLNTQFYNGNGQHNTLRFKYSAFRCIDIFFNPVNRFVYWKEM